jgi:hypothetical protein
MKVESGLELETAVCFEVRYESVDVFISDKWLKDEC